MAPTVYTAGTLCGAYLIWRRPSPHSSGQPHAPPGLHLHPPGPSNLTTQEMISLHNQGAGKGKEEGCRYVGEVGWRWGGGLFGSMLTYRLKHLGCQGSLQLSHFLSVHHPAPVPINMSSCSFCSYTSLN